MLASVGNPGTDPGDLVDEEAQERDNCRRTHTHTNINTCQPQHLLSSPTLQGPLCSYEAGDP
ncbi:unnamed protein product [Protopolystoma xenopodis]|uniref:Uncharacterized protein n=1 Tax=Protopolystoma xenopodis TaxID=117903 RepID=A0A448WV87_9PLAT|nr:unnamed protein product [Protopolystoma xenopodis]